MNRYITTTLPYVNADPHIGHALEFVQADALARAWRLRGENVFFNSGTDEHGQKIFEAATKAGKEVQAYVDHYAEEFRKLYGALGIDEIHFIRTTDAKHIEAAQEMWRRCAAAGDIYKKTYTGLYCVGCELYKTEKDLTPEGYCLIHTNLKAEEISEENYFFRFSKYAQALRDYLSKDGVILPEWRREEAIAFVSGGLEDFSISREKARLSWGVPVPGDDTQVMYVWFDALTSYISTLGWPADMEGNFKTFWEEGRVLQMAGKDQVRFQSLIFQAMLMSADIKNTDQVYYHGFINSGGQKMSKSLGNVISPYDLVKKYGTEATRYMLLRHVHPTEDTDVTWERLDEWYTANLVNGLGNLVSRVMQMSSNNDIKLEEHQEQFAVSRMQADGFFKNANVALDNFKFNESLNAIWAAVAWADAYINQEEPYKKIKTEPGEAKKVIQILLEDLIQIATALSPFMPATSAAIKKAVLENKKPENLFPRLAD